MVLLIQYVVLTFEPVDGILWCHHSNETWLNENLSLILGIHQVDVRPDPKVKYTMTACWRRLILCQNIKPFSQLHSSYKLCTGQTGDEECNYQDTFPVSRKASWVFPWYFFRLKYRNIYSHKKHWEFQTGMLVPTVSVCIQKDLKRNHVLASGPPLIQ